MAALPEETDDWLNISTRGILSHRRHQRPRGALAGVGVCHGLEARSDMLDFADLVFDVTAGRTHQHDVALLFADQRTRDR